MKMRTFNPQLAELMSELEKSPLNTTLRTFADIVSYMRSTHALLMISRAVTERPGWTDLPVPALTGLPA